MAKSDSIHDPMFNAPIGNDHAHDVDMRFTFEPRLEAMGRCTTMVADTLQLGLDSLSRVRIYQLATVEDCDGLSKASSGAAPMRPFVTDNQWDMKVGADHG